MQITLRNWVEIDAAALTANLRQIRARLTHGALLGAVIKSNAYGHGMLPIAEIAAAAGVDWFCVNDVAEAVLLRREGYRQPILVMGYVPLNELEQVLANDVDVVVSNQQTLMALAAAAEKVGRAAKVHLKLETGTYRQGILPADLPAIVRMFAASKHLKLVGMTTHFANIEDTTDHNYAFEQFAVFERVTRELAEQHVTIPMRHIACSAATLLFDQTHLDMVRVGISMYGLWSSRETYISHRERRLPTVELQPALTWKTCIAQVKSVPQGACVGYGCTYRTTHPSRIAVLPVGYFEGYDRGLSGVAHVLVRGRRASICGRICMNMCMVDVTDIPEAQLEDEVVLLGHQGDEHISAEQLAAWCGTINYEVVTRINASLPRIVVHR
jgi:alanine racemase